MDDDDGDDDINWNFLDTLIYNEQQQEE